MEKPGNNKHIRISYLEVCQGRPGHLWQISARTVAKLDEEELTRSLGRTPYREDAQVLASKPGSEAWRQVWSMGSWRRPFRDVAYPSLRDERTRGTKNAPVGARWVRYLLGFEEHRREVTSRTSDTHKPRDECLRPQKNSPCHAATLERLRPNECQRPPTQPVS